MLEVMLLIVAGWLALGFVTACLLSAVLREADRVEQHYLRRNGK